MIFDRLNRTAKNALPFWPQMPRDSRASDVLRESGVNWVGKALQRQ